MSECAIENECGNDSNLEILANRLRECFHGTIDSNWHGLIAEHQQFWRERAAKFELMTKGLVWHPNQEDAIERLTALFYLLMRNEVPTGSMCNAVREAAASFLPEGVEREFENKELEQMSARYARELLGIEEVSA